MEVRVSSSHGAPPSLLEAGVPHRPPQSTAGGELGCLGFREFREFREFRA